MTRLERLPAREGACECFAAQDTYEAVQLGPRQADQFIAMYDALVFQTLLDPDRYLRAQGVVPGIYGSADDG